MGPYDWAMAYGFIGGVLITIAWFYDSKGDDK
jgi:hypothetical protein